MIDESKNTYIKEISKIYDELLNADLSSPNFLKQPSHQN